MRGRRNVDLDQKKPKAGKAIDRTHTERADSNSEKLIMNREERQTQGSAKGGPHRTGSEVDRSCLLIVQQGGSNNS